MKNAISEDLLVRKTNRSTSLYHDHEKKCTSIGKIKILFESKIVNIFFCINLGICFGFSKELIETFLLSTQNICFGYEIRKNNFQICILIEEPDLKHTQVHFNSVFTIFDS